MHLPSLLARTWARWHHHQAKLRYTRRLTDLTTTTDPLDRAHLLAQAADAYATLAYTAPYGGTTTDRLTDQALLLRILATAELSSAGAQTRLDDRAAHLGERAVLILTRISVSPVHTRPADYRDLANALAPQGSLCDVLDDVLQATQLALVASAHRTGR